MLKLREDKNHGEADKWVCREPLVGGLWWKTTMEERSREVGLKAVMGMMIVMIIMMMTTMAMAMAMIKMVKVRWWDFGSEEKKFTPSKAARA